MKEEPMLLAFMILVIGVLMVADSRDRSGAKLRTEHCVVTAAEQDLEVTIHRLSPGERWKMKLKLVDGVLDADVTVSRDYPDNMIDVNGILGDGEAKCSVVENMGPAPERVT